MDASQEAVSSVAGHAPYPMLAAQCIAVWPSSVLAFGSAPYFKRRLSGPWCPLPAAKCRAVAPLHAGSRALTLTPVMGVGSSSVSKINHAENPSAPPFVNFKWVRGGKQGTFRV
jgi:predicted ATP-grasp superfamily ATP-dependent carboligase